jgi:hypothetical protein
MTNDLSFDFKDEDDLHGLVPESWLCVDCGVNTAPGLFNRVQMERAFAAAGENGVDQRIDSHSEVYQVRDAVWKRAGMEPEGGCLCIGCLEKRLGRRLKPKDFPHDAGLNDPRVPGTARLQKRRKNWQQLVLKRHGA